jgi:ribosome-binding factor A
MSVAVVQASLLVPGCRSLKDKRSVVKGLVERARNRFNASVAETGSLDVLQRADLGAALVSNDPGVAASEVNDIRLARLSEVVKERAARAILYELKDPRLGFITVTGVKLASDLTQCVILWSVIGTRGERSKTEHALEAAKGFVQSAVAKAMETRKTPRLYFKYDPSLEKAQKVNEILSKLRKERGEEDPQGLPTPTRKVDGSSEE